MTIIPMNAQSCWIGCVAAAALSLSATSVPAQAQVKVDPKLPEYKAVNGVSGSLKSVGSDTMNEVMTCWCEGFGKFYPEVQFENEGRGRTTGAVALIAGTANFGLMEREFNANELKAFKKKHGHEPTALTTCVDMVAVFVHKNNPIQGLTLQQVDAIFSRTRKGGSAKAIATWGDLGLEGEWSARPIALIGRNSASSTYGYFKQQALFNGDFRDEVKEQPGNSHVIKAVASDKYAIGYAGILYRTTDVRAVPLAKDVKSAFIPAKADRAHRGDYPLARKLFMYVNHKPGTELDPLRREFVRYIYSKQGQSDVVKCGHVPVDEAIAVKALEPVGLKR